MSIEYLVKGVSFYLINLLFSPVIHGSVHDSYTSIKRMTGSDNTENEGCLRFKSVLTYGKVMCS